MSSRTTLARRGLRRASVNPIRAWMACCPQLHTLASLCEGFAVLGKPLPRPVFSRWARRDGWTTPGRENRELIQLASLDGVPAEAWFERADSAEIESVLITKFVRRLTEQRR